MTIVSPLIITVIMYVVFLIQISQVTWTRYTSGYVCTLIGGAISWMSNLQEIVALSTTKVEYIVSSHACKEEIWIRRLLR